MQTILKILIVSLVLSSAIGCQLIDQSSSRYPNSPISLEKAKFLDEKAIPLDSHFTLANADSKGGEIWSDIGPNEIWARNVARPTLLPILPKRHNANRASVLVIPGGGFQFISLANEGYPIAQWLANQGIAAFVLKYRTMKTPRNETEFSKYLQQIFEHRKNGDPIDRSEGLRLATSDASAAIQLIKARSEQWNIDTKRIGILGFSAGAMTAMNLISSSESAPDIRFAGYIYGPMGDVKVPKKAPPLFVALARDDELFSGDNFGLVESWIAAEQSVEFHLYAGGKHGFGSKEKGLTSDLWIEQFYAWLKAQKVVK